VGKTGKEGTKAETVLGNPQEKAKKKGKKTKGEPAALRQGRNPGNNQRCKKPFRDFQVRLEGLTRREERRGKKEKAGNKPRRPGKQPKRPTFKKRTQRRR